MLAAKLGLPKEYAFAHNGMLEDLVRFVDLGGTLDMTSPVPLGYPKDVQ